MDKVIITSQWETRTWDPFRVTRGVYIGPYIQGGDEFYVVMDVDYRAEYYVEQPAFRWAASNFHKYKNEIGCKLGHHRFELSLNNKRRPVVTLAQGDWWGGCCPDWVSVSENSISFDITHTEWIISGYVVLSPANK